MNKTRSALLTALSLFICAGCDDGTVTYPAETQSQAAETQTAPTQPEPEESQEPTYRPPEEAHLSTTGPDSILTGILTDAQRAVADGQTDRAFELLRQAINYDEHSYEAHRLLYDVQLGLGDHNGAAQSCASIIDENLTSGIELVQLQMDCAQTYLELDDNVEAERIANLTVQAAPNRLEPLVLLSGIYLQDGRPQDCIDLLEESVSSGAGPVTLAALSNLGLAYSQVGRFDDAISTLERAHELNSYRTDIMLNLAETYMRVGRMDECVALLERVVLIEPDNESIRQQLEELR